MFAGRTSKKYFEEGCRVKLKKSIDAVSLWSEPLKRKQALSRQARFFAFLERHGFRNEPRLLNGTNFELGIAPLNSAWRASSDEDKNFLFISTSQVLEHYESIKDCEVRIAAFHHPISWLHEEEQDEMTGLIGSHFHIVCTGHRHSVESNRHDGPREHALFLTAKAIWDEQRPSGAHTISILFQNGTATVETEHLVYVNRHNTFAPDVDVSN